MNCPRHRFASELRQLSDLLRRETGLPEQGEHTRQVHQRSRL